MARRPAWKQRAYEEAENSWVDLHDDGYKLEKLTDYHWRCKGIDIWPSSMKYKDRKGNIKEYTDFNKFVRSL